MEDIYFYLNEHDYAFVQSLEGLKGYDFRQPQLNWVWATYYRLEQKGYTNLKLVNKLPKKGIVVMASNQGTVFKKFPKEIFVVLTVADSPPWFYSQINISQNAFQQGDYPNLFSFPVWKHISHWPQPNLIPRHKERGDRLETVAFFGDKSQIAPELLSDDFGAEMTKLGLRFSIINKDFNDYSSIDLVLAIRSFSTNPMFHKPYSKLINAWKAEVPVIVGDESSFQSIKKSPLDFIAVKTKAELINAIENLRSNASLRKQMINNGIERSKEFTEEAILKQWEDLLFKEVPLYYQKWKSKSTLGRALFYYDLFLSRSFRSIKKRLTLQHH